MNNRLNTPQTPLGTDWGRPAATSTVTRNKVLRNTYWLLAMSMIPTMLGAWVGLKTGITLQLSGVIGLVVFLAGSFGFIYAIEKNKNSAAGVPLLLGFTFFMGLMLSRILSVVLGMGKGEQIIMMAATSTVGVFFTMALLASVIKRDLSGLGKWLFVGALVVFFGAILNIVLFQSTAMMMAISTMVVGVFSMYILYDLKRIIDGGETNYISATLSLYLDIYNVFQGLLSLFGFASGD